MGQSTGHCKVGSLNPDPALLESNTAPLESFPHTKQLESPAENVHFYLHLYLGLAENPDSLAWPTCHAVALWCCYLSCSSKVLLPSHGKSSPQRPSLPASPHPHLPPCSDLHVLHLSPSCPSRHLMLFITHWFVFLYSLTIPLPCPQNGSICPMGTETSKCLIPQSVPTSYRAA